MMSIRSFALLTAVGVLVTSCDGPTAPTPIASIEVTAPTTVMAVGTNLQLTAVVKGRNGTTLTGRPVTWLSSDTSRATVSSSGLVTALSPGLVTVTAASGGVKGELPLVIEPGALAAIQMEARDSTIIMGRTTTLSLTYRDSAGNVITSMKGALFSSSDTAIATIDTAGVVIGKYEGVVTLRATANAITGSISIRVLLDPSLPEAYWKQIANAIPNLSSYYRAIGVGSFVPLVADINQDGREDLVLHFWHMRTLVERLTLSVDAPAPNRLAILVAGADGVLRDSTAAIVGSENVDLTGSLSRNVRSYDLNQDGYPDWVYALNREDGRPCGIFTTQCSNWFSQGAALMSSGRGRYRVEPFGEMNYHHTVAILPFTDRTEIVTSGSRAAPDGRSVTEAYQFAGATFTPISGYPPIGLTLAFPVISASANLTSHFVFSGNPVSFPGPDQLMVATPTAGRTWSVTDSLQPGVKVTPVDWTSWNGETCLGCTFMFTENGLDFVTMAYSDGCSYRPTAQAPPRVVVKRESYLIVGGANGRTAFTENSGTRNDQRLIAYDVVGDKLVRTNAISFESIPEVVADISCGDVNDDGFDDLVVYPLRSGARPIIYLNDRTGQLVRLPDSLLPVGPNGDFHMQWSSLLIDTDGDRIKDLIYYPRSACSADEPCATFLMYRGRRHLQLPGNAPAPIQHRVPSRP